MPVLWNMLWLREHEKNDKNVTYLMYFLSQSSYQLTPWEGVSWYRNVFLLFSYPKKLRGDFFPFWCFEDDQRTHPKRNKQQWAQTLVAIDIFVKNKCHPLWREIAWLQQGQFFIFDASIFWNHTRCNQLCLHEPTTIKTLMNFEKKH